MASLANTADTGQTPPLKAFPKIKTSGFDRNKTISEIYFILSKKPLVEISGPEIFSQENRTYFNLNELPFIQEYAYLNSENVLIRGGETSHIKFEEIYKGFKESDFQKLYNIFNKLLD